MYTNVDVCVFVRVCMNGNNNTQCIVSYMLLKYRWM